MAPLLRSVSDCGLADRAGASKVLLNQFVLTMLLLFLNGNKGESFNARGRCNSTGQGLACFARHFAVVVLVSVHHFCSDTCAVSSVFLLAW